MDSIQRAIENDTTILHGGVQKLLQVIQQNPNTEAKKVIYTFMCQIIDMYHQHELEQWRTLAKKIVWNSFDSPNPIRKTCPNQASGLLRKMRLTDIRNRIAFSILRFLGVAIDTSFERSYNTNATEKQIKAFQNMAHGKALVKSAIDVATLNNVLQWMHLVKMCKQIQSSSQPINSCTVYWYQHIQQHGLASLIWELFLDVYNYDILD